MWIKALYYKMSYLIPELSEEIPFTHKCIRLYICVLRNTFFNIRKVNLIYYAK